jgi:hypothetical protein
MAPKTYTWTGLAYGADGYEERTYTVTGPLYHGGRRRLAEGAQLTTGQRTNPWGDEGPKSRYVHFTTRLEVAADYARRCGRGYVYEVEPTGEFSMGYSGDEYKSEHPLTVVRRLEPREWQ